MTKVKDKVVESRNLWAGLGAIVIAGGILLFVNMASVDSNYVSIWLGFIGLYLTNVIGKMKSLKAGEDFANRVDKALNGDLEARIAAAVREALDSVGPQPDSAPVESDSPEVPPEDRV